MLEIGVGQGGSLDLWRSYLGPNAVLNGLDIDPECLERVSPPNQVRIGSQADGDFLMRVVAEMGRPNIVLDDGSHLGAHQIKSFRVLFPLLQKGGVYVIEDLHTSYWDAYHGGKGTTGTGVGLIKALIDDQHACYHTETETYSPARHDRVYPHFRFNSSDQEGPSSTASPLHFRRRNLKHKCLKDLPQPSGFESFARPLSLRLRL